MNMNKTQGFTLIELMIVIAIIAILAAIALPAYQDYTIRAKMSEPIVAADACKNSVAEFHQTLGRLPASLASAGCSSNATQYIASLGVAAGGVITVITSADVSLGTAASTNIVLTPTATSVDAPLLWSCAASTTPDKFLPAICRS
jgi:type IV pilus assembly protein PilA